MEKVKTKLSNGQRWVGQVSKCGLLFFFNFQAEKSRSKETGRSSERLRADGLAANGGIRTINSFLCCFLVIWRNCLSHIPVIVEHVSTGPPQEEAHVWGKESPPPFWSQTMSLLKVFNQVCSKTLKYKKFQAFFGHKSIWTLFFKHFFAKQGNDKEHTKVCSAAATYMSNCTFLHAFMERYSPCCFWCVEETGSKEKWQQQSKCQELL